jgi:anti-sigma factor RsiW
MLPDRYSQLLTAFVDGQLSTRQRKAALRLLRRSEEARKLYRKLQKDSRDLIELPPVKLPGDFPQQVLRTIAATGVRPAPAAAQAARSAAFPGWVGMAAAAAVFLGITTGS